MGDPLRFFIFEKMFVRKKKNKSGSISIQIITKIKGKSKLIKTIGSSKDPNEIKKLEKQAKEFITTYQQQQIINFSSEQQIIKTGLQHISSHTEVGTELLLGSIFEQIGFNKVDNDILRKLVITRLSNPVSKLKTSSYLEQTKNVYLPVHQIYRYLDKLYREQKEQIQQIPR